MPNGPPKRKREDEEDGDDLKMNEVNIVSGCGLEVNQEDDSGDFYEDGIEYLDDRTGLPLDAKLVAAA